MSLKNFSILVLLGLLSISGILYTIKYKSSFLTTKNKQTHLAKEKSWNSMAAEVDSWVDALGKPIDINIKETIIILNLLGFKTSQSCEGHMDWGRPYPWVSFSTEDVDIEKLLQKQSDIGDKIRKEEQKLAEKYPNTHISKIDVDSEAPELIVLWKQSREAGEQIERLSQMKLIKLQDLINQFYKKHTGNYDQILLLSAFGLTGYELLSIGSNWQATRDQDAKKKKLKEYQKEMSLFTEFLKDYYWSCFDPQRDSRT